MYKRIVERLETSPDLRAEDVFISVLETAVENWSFGGDAVVQAVHAQLKHCLKGGAVPRRQRNVQAATAAVAHHRRSRRAAARDMVWALLRSGVCGRRKPARSSADDESVGSRLGPLLRPCLCGGGLRVGPGHAARQPLRRRRPEFPSGEVRHDAGDRSDRSDRGEPSPRDEWAGWNDRLRRRIRSAPGRYLWRCMSARGARSPARIARSRTPHRRLLGHYRILAGIDLRT
jgi:hypothetical protein